MYEDQPYRVALISLIIVKKTELYRLKTQSFVFNLIAFLFRSNYKDLLNYIINYTCLGMARN